MHSASYEIIYTIPQLVQLAQETAGPWTTTNHVGLPEKASP